MTPEDHDILIRVANNVDHLVRRQTEIIETLSTHMEDDKRGFAFLNKLAWGAIGVAGFVGLISKFHN